MDSFFICLGNTMPFPPSHLRFNDGKPEKPKIYLKDLERI